MPAPYPMLCNCSKRETFRIGVLVVSDLQRVADLAAITRRELLKPALASGVAVLATTAMAQAAAAQPRPESQTTARAWNMMFDIYLRFPPGRFDDWVRFWGGQTVAILEEGGQHLWAAWYGLTGQQDTVTHQWAYRDLAHFEDMEKMRRTNPRLQAAPIPPVPMDATLFSALMTPLPYHPVKVPTPSAGDTGVLVTHRILRPTIGDPKTHARLMQEYVALATNNGAEMLGAFETFFGWSPSYLLHLWRYRSMDHYWSSREAITETGNGPRLQAAMRAIYPQEVVDLQRPTPYSRLR